jgi:hypothetical protein
MDNIIKIFGKDDEVQQSIFRILEHAKKDIEDYNIVNCMIIMVDDDDTITYSYANFYRKVTMIGAIEKLKHIYIEDDKEN